MTTPRESRKVGTSPAIMALVGAVLIAIGAGLWAVPAGVITGGAEMVIAAYLVAYWRVRG